MVSNHFTNAKFRKGLQSRIKNSQFTFKLDKIIELQERETTRANQSQFSNESDPMLQTVQPNQTSALLRHSIPQVTKFDGEIVVERIGDKSELSKLYSSNPIRFMPLARSTTSLPSSAALDIKYVTTAQFGPGIGGSNPERSIRLHVKQSSGICLTSATSTKVIRSKAENPCKNVIDACVEDMGFLFYAPEPLLPSTDSSLTQLQSFELRQNASVAALEWILSVRKNSELDAPVWTLNRYESTMNLRRDSGAFSERVVLDNTDHCLDERVRVNEKEALNVVGRFVLYGSQCHESIQKLLNMAERLDTLHIMYNSDEDVVGFSVKNCDPKNIQRHDVFFSVKSFDNNQGLVLYFAGFNREAALHELIQMMDPTLSALLKAKQ